MLTIRFLNILMTGALMLLMVSCAEENQGAGEKDSADSISIDNQESSRGLEGSAMRPGLVGTWKLVDMRMDNEPLAQAIPGNRYLEFLNDGQLVLTSDEYAPDTAAVSQNGDMLASSVWLSEQRIDSLTGNRLILVDMLDGAEVAYIYERQ